VAAFLQENSPDIQLKENEITQCRADIYKKIIITVICKSPSGQLDEFFTHLWASHQTGADEFY
jgi:hypothetical protein